MDVEAVLIAELPGEIGDVRCVTELPADLEGSVPIVELARLGGPRRGALDFATVDFDCYAATRQQARDLAHRVGDALQRLRARKVTGGEITRVDIDSGPNWRPYDNTAIRRFGVTAQVIVQPRS